ncbi:chromosomal replication initiator protein DnaA [Falseniella ignava]
MKEKQFWNRILEFAQERLTRSMYDFYATPAELVKVEENIATIFLPRSEMEMVWEKQLKDIIIAAGFEIYDSEIKPHYIFTKPKEQTSYHVAESKNTPNSDYLHVLPTIPYSETGLKEKYTFDNFVQGDGNIWAKSAALAVSEDLATTYNPLFIYGGPGLGKTHLINAIGNEILKNIPDARVKYIPAESFINDFLEHLRLGEMEKFKKTYRSLDLLLIDDIQSLSGKKVATQEEFFNTFNALHGSNKQIVLTSDRSPEHLENLEERLVTRFGWGLTQHITPPDFETRIAILQSKIENLNYHFQSDTLEYLAGQFDSNVRELEGAINDITLIAKVKKINDITIDIAAEAIRARKQGVSQVLIIPIDKIQAEVGNFYGVSVKEIKGTRRVQNIVLARQVAMYLARELTDNSLPKIGKEFGGKDHTTVIHAHGKIKSMIDIDDNLHLEIEAIKKKIK